MTKVTKEQIKEIAKVNAIEEAALKSFLDVESGSTGFDPKTGKIIIQFEPGYYRRLAPEVYRDYLRILNIINDKKNLATSDNALFAKYKMIFNNKVEGQVKEWEAFSAAFGLNPKAAMRSTSIGMGQVMGDNYSSLGYSSVDDMWTDARRGEYQQVLQIISFIKSKPALYKALTVRNWHLVAYYYNGSGYEAMAKRLNREPYNISMEKTYNKYKLN
jgi:hypothetical protein